MFPMLFRIRYPDLQNPKRRQNERKQRANDDLPNFEFPFKNVYSHISFFLSFHRVIPRAEYRRSYAYYVAPFFYT